MVNDGRPKPSLLLVIVILKAHHSFVDKINIGHIIALFHGYACLMEMSTMTALDVFNGGNYMYYVIACE